MAALLLCNAVNVMRNELFKFQLTVQTKVKFYNEVYLTIKKYQQVNNI